MTDISRDEVCYEMTKSAVIGLMEDRDVLLYLVKTILVNDEDILNPLYLSLMKSYIELMERENEQN